MKGRGRQGRSRLVAKPTIYNAKPSLQGQDYLLVSSQRLHNDFKILPLFINRINPLKLIYLNFTADDRRSEIGSGNGLCQFKSQD